MAEIKRSIINEENVKPFRSPQQRRQRLIAFIVVAVVIGLAIGAYFLLVPRQASYRLADYQIAQVTRSNLVQTTQASGTVIITTVFDLPAQESGQAASLFVSEGDVVTEGQVLARMEVPDLEDDLFDLEAELESARQSLEKSIQQNEITINRKIREIESFDRDIADQEIEVDRVAELLKMNAAKQSEFDGAQDTLEDLQESKLEKEIQLDEDRRIQELDLEISQATIRSIETKIERIEEKIEESTVRSPMDGEIISLEAKLAVPGSLISSNTVLFTIVDPDSAVVELEVEEQYSAALREGDLVELTISNRKMNGRIESIGRVAQMSSDGLSATIAVQIRPELGPDDPNSELLLQGATAVGVFELGVKEGILLLPRGPYLTTGSQRYLYRVEGNSAERIDVTFGDVQGTVIEVLSGVEAGDEIIISGYQNYIEYKNVSLGGGD